jgi:hypothetical protein
MGGKVTMILSVSRRTDIPAFYGEWFINRLTTAEVMVRNPMNARQVTVIPLSPENVDCIVFWTKNPSDFLQYLDQIDSLGYKYYFLFTLNSYDKGIEENVDYKKKIIQTFQQLSNRIGPERVIWRYDPIILSSRYDLAYHSKGYEYLAKTLAGYTQECVISFLDQYKKIESNMRRLDVMTPEFSDIEIIADRLSSISRQYGMRMSSCAHKFDLSRYNISHSKCIDDDLIEKVTGRKIRVKKDPSQREVCGCVESRDIGSYNTCQHFCRYCYANCGRDAVRKNIEQYDPHSPLLCDRLKGDEVISKYRKSKSLIVENENQQELM